MCAGLGDHMVACVAARAAPEGDDLFEAGQRGSADGRAAPRAEINLAQRPEVAGVRTSVVYEHIRNPRIRRPLGVAREARH